MNIYKVIIRKMFIAKMDVNAKNEKEALNKSIDLICNCNEATLSSNKIFESGPIYSYEVEKCILELENSENKWNN